MAINYNDPFYAGTTADPNGYWGAQSQLYASGGTAGNNGAAGRSTGFVMPGSGTSGYGLMSPDLKTAAGAYASLPGANVYSSGGVNVQDYSHVDPYQAAIAGGMNWRKPEDLYSAWQSGGSPSGLGPAAGGAAGGGQQMTGGNSSGGAQQMMSGAAGAGEPAGAGGIAGLYQQYLGRAPDAGGMDFYKNQLSSGMSMGDLSKEFQNSPEYLSQHPASTGASTGAQPGASTGGYGLSSNPYQGGQANAIRNQQSQLLDHAMSQIGANSVATGGYGGSRQGVAEGVAAGQAATGLDSALANLYSTNWNQDQNRGLQQYGMDQNFYTGQRGLDLQQAGLGATLYGLGQQGQWSNLQNYNNILSPYTGFGTSTSGTQQGGGGIGALGGAGAGYQLFKGLFS